MESRLQQPYSNGTSAYRANSGTFGQSSCSYPANPNYTHSYGASSSYLS